MSGHLERLAARAQGRADLLRTRTPSLFEPPGATAAPPGPDLPPEPAGVAAPPAPGDGMSAVAGVAAPPAPTKPPPRVLPATPAPPAPSRSSAQPARPSDRDVAPGRSPTHVARPPANLAADRDGPSALPAPVAGVGGVRITGPAPRTPGGRPAEHDHASVDDRAAPLPGSQVQAPAAVERSAPRPPVTSLPRSPGTSDPLAVPGDPVREPAGPKAGPGYPSRRGRPDIGQREAPEPPVVKVTIGRVIVRAVMRPAQPPVERPAAPPTVSLDDYLSQDPWERS